MSTEPPGQEPSAAVPPPQEQPAATLPPQQPHPVASLITDYIASTNETAKSSTTTIIGFLATAAYLALSVAGTTDQQLLLDTNVIFPIVNVGVPCSWFYILSPLLLVILHLNMLFEEQLLLDKVYFLQYLHANGDVQLSDLRQLLTNLTVAVAVGWRARWYVRATVSALHFVVKVVVPVSLLLFMEIRFLPYHHPLFRWWLPLLVLFDLAIIFIFLYLTRFQRALDLIDWPVVRSMAVVGYLALPALGLSLTDWAIWRSIAKSLAVFGGVALLALGLSVGYLKLPDLPCDSGSVHVLRRLWITPFLSLSRKTILAGSDASGRDLRCADFSGATLQRVNFEGSNLEGARFDSAHLEGAKFGRRNDMTATVVEVHETSEDTGPHTCDLGERDIADRTILKAAHFDGARLMGAEFAYARLDDARFVGAYLMGADFARARLDGAHLMSAHLSGAKFDATQADWADFTEASGINVAFSSACLRGAAFSSANLRHSRFVNADIEAASLSKARLELSDFTGASLIGSDLGLAVLDGVSGLSLQAVDLRGAKLAPVVPCLPAEQAKTNSATRATEGSVVGSEPTPPTVDYSDLRDARFQVPTTKDWQALQDELSRSFRSEDLQPVKDALSQVGRREAPCVDLSFPHLIYVKAQLPDGAQRIAPPPPAERQFYRNLASFLVDRRDLIPFLAKAVPRLARRAAGPTTFDVAVACQLLERRRQAKIAQPELKSLTSPTAFEGPFLAVDEDLARGLRSVAKDCPVVLAGSDEENEPPSAKAARFDRRAARPPIASPKRSPGPGPSAPPP